MSTWHKKSEKDTQKIILKHKLLTYTFMLKTIHPVNKLPSEGMSRCAFAHPCKYKRAWDKPAHLYTTADLQIPNASCNTIYIYIYILGIYYTLFFFGHMVIFGPSVQPSGMWYSAVRFIFLLPSGFDLFGPLDSV